MKTNNRYRILSWNLNSGIFLGEEPTSGATKEGISYAARCIARLEPDIVALQEVLLPHNEGAASSQASQIAAGTNFPYLAESRLSPSHLVEGADLGLAVLSRYPIDTSKKILLPNPRLEYGALRSHDKGLLNVRLSTPTGQVWLTCGHLPPFHRFHRLATEPDFTALWDAIGRTFTELMELPTIGCIDFNTDKVSTLVPQHFASGFLRELIHSPTRPTGQRHDQIICSKEWTNIATKVIPSRFDHHLCVADLSFEPKLPERTSRARERVQEKQLLILHLSDLHFGEGMQDDVDWKTFVNFATRETRRDRLSQFIRALPRVPDYVIVSGDLTIAGRENGYEIFTKTIDELINAGSLPEVNRIVVVPGNHDIARTPGNSPESERKRWDLFIKHIGSRFTRPWIPSHDSRIDELLARLDSMIERDSDQYGGISLELDPKLSTTKTWSLPFIWDRARNILIYAFNSASISGSRITLSAEVEAAMEWLRHWNDPNRKQVEAVLNAFEKELWVDPARIAPQEIAVFTAIMDRLHRKSPAELDATLKIAVLHHHVTPIATEEFSKFELLTNAGRFKRELKSEGFKVIFHGHKHWPEVLRDAVIPGEEPQFIISGGTIGGGQASGRQPGFFLLEYDEAKQNLSTGYVVLKESGNPRKSIVPEQEIMLDIVPRELEKSLPTESAPVSIRFPELRQQTEKSLMAFLRRQIANTGDERVGWSHSLHENRVSVIATAYGVRILSLTGIDSRLSHDHLQRVLASLLAFRHGDGGWSTSSQSGTRSQPEPTAFALWGLHAWNRWEEVEEGKLVLERLIDPSFDPILWRHVYPVAIVGRVLAEIDPHSVWLPKIADALSEAAYRNSRGKFLCWGRQTLRHADDGFGWSDTLGSVIHTAHAIYTLSKICKVTAGRTGVTPEQLREACEWLLIQDEWANTTEDINRYLETGKYDRLAVRHFTLPWVVLALIEAGYSPDHVRVRSAIQELLFAHKNGLWSWGGTERPIWATHDALFAILSYIMAASTA